MLLLFLESGGGQTSRNFSQCPGNEADQTEQQLCFGFCCGNPVICGAVLFKKRTNFMLQKWLLPCLQTVNSQRKKMSQKHEIYLSLLVSCQRFDCFTLFCFLCIGFTITLCSSLADLPHFVHIAYLARPRLPFNIGHKGQPIQTGFQECIDRILEIGHLQELQHLSQRYCSYV